MALTKLLTHLAIGYSKAALILGIPDFLWTLWIMRDDPEFTRVAESVGPIAYIRLFLFETALWPFWLLRFVWVTFFGVLAAIWVLIDSSLHGEKLHGERSMSGRRLAQGFVALVASYVAYRCLK
jgi:hypothetical protein